MPVPTAEIDLDAAWFTRALREASRLERGRVASVELTPLATQGKASRTYRARLAYDSEDLDAPASAIVKMALTEPGYLARRLGLGTYRLEVDFYRLVAPRLGDLVPAAYVAEVDDTTGHFVIAMEDLAPARPAGHDLEADLLATALGLARVHARCWGDERVADVLSRCALPGMLDQRRIGATERQLTQSLLERKLAQHTLPEAIVAATRAELEHHERFAAHLRARPLTCCHGDSHLSQVLFPSADGGRFAIIDWQTPHYASGALDLCALLLTAGLPHRERRSLEPRLLDTYHRALIDEGVTDYPRAALEHDHRLLLHHRLRTALMLPYRDTPADIELWRNRFVEPLAAALEDADYVGLVEGL